MCRVVQTMLLLVEPLDAIASVLVLAEVVLVLVRVKL